MVTVNNIPDEILEFVFSKLPLCDRKTVRLVNKHWLEVCNSPSITKHEIMRVKRNDLRLLHGTDFFLKIDVNLHVFVDDDDDYDDVFWIRHGHSVKSLLMWNLHINCGILTNIMNYCCQLTKLTLYFECKTDDFYVADNADAKIVDGNTKLHCPEILELFYVPLSFLSGAEFMRLTNSVENLKSLELYYIHIKEHLAVGKILSIIAKQAFTLTEIVFKDCHFVTDTFLENVLEMLGPQLSGIYLSKLPTNSIDCFYKHAVKFSLKKFRFSQMSECPFFLSRKNMPFSFLSEFKDLKSLDISETDCTANGFLTLFGLQVHPNLIELKMSRVESLSDDILATILPNIPNLKILDVSLCNEISSIGVQSIIYNCKHLTHLDLSFCDNIENITEPTSINNIVNLVRLNMDCSGLDSSSVMKLSFHELKEIGLEDIYLSEETLGELLKNCPKLKLVNVGDSVRESIAEYAVVGERGLSLEW